MKTIVDEYLPRENADEQKRGRTELEELPRKRKEQREEKEPMMREMRIS